MALSVPDLINQGALVYAQTRVSRQDTPREVLDRLRGRYPGQPEADLEYVLELAQSEEALKAEIASAPRNTELGPGKIPFVPGLPRGVYQVDIAYVIAGSPGPAGRRGFFRLDIDTIDLTIGLFFWVIGSVPLLAGYWQRIRNLLLGSPSVQNLGDVAQVISSELPPGTTLPEAQRSIPVPPLPTPAIIDEIVIRVPEDEPEVIIFPPDWKKYLKKGGVSNPRVLFIGRG